MVGYYSESQKLNPTDVMIAGAGSGFLTRALCQPLDVLKIRFQLQVEPISEVSISKYRSMLQALVIIVQEEGAKSLWKGHVPAQYLSIAYGLIQFGLYEATKQKLGTESSFQMVSDFYCGALAGSAATLFSFPFDVVRTRLVAQNENFKVYKGVTDTFVKIITKEGYLALFKGLLPTVIQVAPHTGVQFMSFKLFESIYRKLVSNSREKRQQVFTSSLICGSLAGLCAKTVIYPFDLCRKRMQIQGFERKAFGKNFVCNGFIDCLKRTYQFEGIRGIYKGLSPSLIKAVCTTALHFTSYDLLCYEIANFKNF